MRTLAVIGALAILTALLSLIVVFSGYFNVAATEPHTPLGRWLLSTAMEQSVRYHAQGIEVPSLGGPAQIAEGFRHYQEHCEACHGAPGVSPGETGEGLTPEPPNLSKTVSRWSAKELFWIIKHGIRMTGMPAWGVSYQDDVLWALVAFVQKLPKITPKAYQKMAASVKHEPHEKAHITLTDQLTFKPKQITIQAGETLVWKNASALVHTVTADPAHALDPKDANLPKQANPFNSGNIPPGGTYRHTFLVLAPTATSVFPTRYRIWSVKWLSNKSLSALIGQ